jgi:hypothetical protein
MKTIEYKVSYEKMISRLPGLFAYLEEDELGNMSLHKATDSSDGCWGKIVENIMLPNHVSLTVDGDVLLNGGGTYTFRTLIDYYYRYKDILESNDSFVEFIEKGIGKVEVPENKKGVATPKFVFLSNVKRLYNELVKMDRQCEFYEANKETLGEDKFLCCLCEKYKELGGDVFKNYIYGLIQTAEDIADEYYGYAQQGMTLDFDVDLVNTYQDYGIVTPYIPIWIPGKKYLKGDKVQYGSELYVCTKSTNGKWNEDSLSVIFDDESFEPVENGMKVFDGTLPYPIEGTTDSKLSDLRRLATYYSVDNIAEKPSNGYDWLFYYRVGDVVNIRTVNDSLGNVVKLSDFSQASKNGNDLAAYGDVIQSIVADKDKYEITFTYILGVHLKADGSYTIVLDDDRNELVKWNKFVWDGDEKTGIKYTETYNYEKGGDLDRLINGTFTLDGVSQTFNFDNYIGGMYDNMLTTYRFEFITYNNTFNYDKKIANQNVNIVSLLTDFSTSRNNFEEFTDSDYFREDYLNGITFQAKKVIDVNIQRGSTSVFDRHIAFGEIKTLDDMVTYKNSSFFRMTVG